MSFTIEYLEFLLLIFVRITAIIYAAPFFGNSNIPRMAKVGIAVFLSFILYGSYEYVPLEYYGVIGYATLVIKEAITGLLIGLGSGLCMYILGFAGHMIDMEIGLSMAQEFDPTTNVQSTVTSNLLTFLFTLLFVVSDMHYFVIDALYDSFEIIPIGEAHLDPNLYTVFVTYIIDLFVIGFRIILPIFSVILVVNIVLGVLAKVAPQMNMFVIGMQLKLLVGLILLYIVMSLFPNVTDFIFTEMQKLTDLFVKMIVP